MDNPQCPEGYICRSGVCTMGAVSTQITTGIVDDDSNVVILKRTGDTVLCYQQSIDSGESGLYSTVISPTGDLTPPALLDNGAADANSTVTDFRGRCGVRQDSLVWATMFESGPQEYDLAVKTNSMGNVQTLMAGLPTAPSFNSLPHLAATTVGSDLWFVHEAFPSSTQFTVQLRREVVDSNNTPQVSSLTLPVATSGTGFVSIADLELIPGQGGAWLYVRFASGQSQFAWVDQNADVRNWWPDPPGLGAYVSASPLAVNDQNELAAIYNVDGTNWQLFWLSSDSTHPTVAGPTFTFPLGLVRPGGLFDMDQLYVAGATGSQDVTVWNIPWDSTAPATHVDAVATKLTSVVVRRAGLVRNHGQLQAVWTELVPSDDRGDTAYVALFTVPLTEAPQ